MDLVNLAVRKKYTTVAALFAVILLGTAALLSLNIQLNPDLDPVIVNIQTSYRGVSPTDVSEQVNEPLEEELGTIEGVDSINAEAFEGTSRIMVEFDYDKDLDVAAVEVQNVIDRIRDDLPEDIDEPRVQKFNPADVPVLTLAVSGPFSSEYLRTLADNELSNRLQLVSGVASIDVFGGEVREIQIEVDRDRINALNIPVSQIVSRLDKENLNIPGGELTSGEEEYLIRSVGKYEDYADIEELVIDSGPAGNVYLREVAEVKDGHADIRSKFRVEGEETAGLSIQKQQDANTIEVVDDLKEEIAQLEKDFPELNLQITDDQSDFVRLAIYNMGETLVLGIFLTFIVMLLFLGSWRNTAAVIISVPTTFVMTLALMQASGLTLNTVTMTALILSIGMLVDNSIVVIENVNRHYQELQKSALNATIDGAREMILPVTAGTTTSMIVLMPVMFIGGFVQQMFRPLSMTLLFAWSGSLLSSFTIVPLLLSVVLNLKKFKKTALSKLNLMRYLLEGFRRLFARSRELYLLLLRKSLRNRAITLTVGGVLLIITLNVFPMLGSEMTPTMDTGQTYISLETEPGSSLTRTEKISKEVEEIIEEEPEIVNYTNQLGYEPGTGTQAVTGAEGVQQAFFSITLTDRIERERSIWDIQADLRRKIAEVPGIKSYVVEEEGATAIGTTQAPLVVRVSGKDPEFLEIIAEDLVRDIEEVPGATNINLRWNVDYPEYQIDVDRVKAAEVGLSTDEISQQITAAVSGIEADTDFKVEEQKDPEIMVRYREEQMASQENLENLIIIVPAGDNLPLRELAEIERVEGPNMVTSKDLRYHLDILGFNHGRSLSMVNQDISSLLDDYQLPAGYTAEITGEQEDMMEAQTRLLISLFFAVAFIYLIMVAQFKSFIHPITIMISLPLELIGVVAALLITGTHLSMPAIMGIILLSGIAVNDAIHLMSFFIMEKKNYDNVFDAICEGARLRYRPIMMTTFSTIAGMTPLALELAVGTEQYSPLAIVTIGGLFSSTMLLLIYVPVVYSLFEDLKKVVF
ncbi:efflux RND transporter permease subunit [Halarsenatibacter silvermanii]|uniref:Heavy metal efflux pump, CzcA family n=1 Tax=Halarsenatibacter silvermanii TaxID=321763 RepID=A0A1G9IC71_9FIRM|nr:efflux RND transporter permease subunit [Halarsenatibacter silvermanii]SDL22801.1 heavy metal efflux pump, CzcA family [Halarsenatibacter silvermanii]